MTPVKSVFLFTEVLHKMDLIDLNGFYYYLATDSIYIRQKYVQNATF